MGKAGKIFNLDDNCLAIIENLGPRDRSDYVRKAINFYHNNKDSKVESKESKPMENVSVEL